MKNSIIISCAIILAAFSLTFGMTRIIKDSRTVTVRGLCEQEVDADMAVWKVSFSVLADDLKTLQKLLQTNSDILIKYLNDYSLNNDDFSILAPEITDTSLNLYIDKSNNPWRYIAKQGILVRSKKVEEVKKASAETQALLAKGLALTSDYDNRVTYEFNGLNEIKPQMIASATENARMAAEQFARDSKSRVGKIQSASQGLFTIEDAATGLEEKKRIRVVTTVIYTLTD